MLGKAFDLALNTDTLTWAVSGPSADEFFVTKSGGFIGSVIPDKGTALRTDGGLEVAFIRDLTIDSTIGATGTGNASEKDVDFDWKLDSK